MSPRTPSCLKAGNCDKLGRTTFCFWPEVYSWPVQIWKSNIAHASSVYYDTKASQNQRGFLARTENSEIQFVFFCERQRCLDNVQPFHLWFLPDQVYLPSGQQPMLFWLYELSSRAAARLLFLEHIESIPMMRSSAGRSQRGNTCYMIWELGRLRWHGTCVNSSQAFGPPSPKITSMNVWVGA